MRLAALIASLPPEARPDVVAPRHAGGDSAPVDAELLEVAHIVHDSRLVGPGDVFCCLRGLVSDGYRFAPTAVEQGAIALLVDRDADVEVLAALGVTILVADDTRAAMAHLAMAAAGHPGGRLRMVGITGTNGKTTTAALLAGVLGHAGVAVDVIGTLTGERTTPEATDLAPALAAIADRGGDVVVMEVSSHALAQHRVDGIGFSLALFTNLTQDHLDFHATMSEYFDAKARLFTPELSRAGLVVVDGDYGPTLLERATIPVRGLSVSRDVAIEYAGAQNVVFVWRGHRIDLPLGGLFTVANALLAAEAAVTLGVAEDVVAAGLSVAPSVPGRFEAVSNDLGIAIVVDYAHTPDGLENVLRSARSVAADGRVLVVFGCGGDRDRAKRPLMGSLAGALADVSIVTSDNPRSEPPDAIIADIVAGMNTPPLIEPDRRAAIRRALAQTAPGDVVVIAGKGHETTQTTGDVVVPFDDRVVAAEEAAAVAEERRR